MSVAIPWPNKRLAYEGVGNPRFVSDIQNGDENLLEAIKMLLGLPESGSTAFAILTGFETQQGGSFSGGIVYMNNELYLCVDGVSTSKYLRPNITDDFIKLHNDENVRPTYRINYAIESDYQVDDMPMFIGTMNEWRLPKLADIYSVRNRSFRIGTYSNIVISDSYSGNNPSEEIADSGITYHYFNVTKGYFTLNYYLNEDTVNAIIDLHAVQYATINIYSDSGKLLYTVTNDNISIMLIKTDTTNDFWVLTENITIL